MRSVIFLRHLGRGSIASKAGKPVRTLAGQVRIGFRDRRRDRKGWGGLASAGTVGPTSVCCPHDPGLTRNAVSGGCCALHSSVAPRKVSSDTPDVCRPATPTPKGAGGG